jgi:hypothetical protein
LQTGACEGEYGGVNGSPITVGQSVGHCAACATAHSEGTQSSSHCCCCYLVGAGSDCRSSDGLTITLTVNHHLEGSSAVLSVTCQYSKQLQHIGAYLGGTACVDGEHSGGGHKGEDGGVNGGVVTVVQRVGEGSAHT